MVNRLDRISFWSLFSVIVFLPIFFLPLTNIPIETSKGLLLVVGLCSSIIFWILARCIDGNIVLVKSRVLFFGAFLLGVFFLSAHHAPAREVSFFGAVLDFGTFYFLLASFLLLFISSLVVRTPKNSKIILLGFILSSLLLFVFQILHLFWPTALSLGVLTQKSDTLMGSWNAFGLFAALFTSLCLFIIEFFNIPRVVKRLLFVFLLVSIAVVLAVNFYVAWGLLGGFALFAFVFKIFLSYREHPNKSIQKYFPFLPFVLLAVSILFFVASGTIGAYVPLRLGLQNTDAGPNLTATTNIGKSVLANHPWLGVGPNGFGEAWALYKPASINNGVFWNNFFEFGSGVLPTLAATTGYVGVFSMVFFFCIFFLSGLRALLVSVKSSAHWETLCFFLGSLFLFLSCFFYTTGPVLFLLAFAFLGMCIGVSSHNNRYREIHILFSNNPLSSFLFLILLIGSMVLTFIFGFKYLERFVSVSPFRSAILNIQNIDTALPAIERALSRNQNELYLRTAAQIYITKFNTLTVKHDTLTEDEKKVLQSSIDKSAASAVLATEINPNNYLNFQMLGLVYQTLGQYGVKDTFNKSIEAYTKAVSLNPLNPGIQLGLARTAYFSGNMKDAEMYATKALNLKQDYVDALISMSQIQQALGNTKGGLLYAQEALTLVTDELNIFKDDESLARLKNDLVEYIDGLQSAINGASANSKTKKVKSSN